MEIRFSSEVTVDTTGMIGKLIYVDGKPYIVDGGIIYLDDSGERGVKLDPIEEPKPIPQTKEVGWENGDTCRYANDINHDYIYIGEYPHGGGHYAFSEEKGITYIANGYLLEPETEAERKEREELEAAYELYCELNNNHNLVEFDRFKMNCKNWLRVVRKTNYKVKGE